MTIDNFSKCSVDNDYCIKYRYIPKTLDEALSNENYKNICRIENDFFMNHLIEHKIIDIKTHTLNDTKVLRFFFNFHADINFENALELNVQITINTDTFFIYNFFIKTFELNALLKQLRQYM